VILQEKSDSEHVGLANAVVARSRWVRAAIGVQEASNIKCTGSGSDTDPEEASLEQAL
jgi:hypothetical protein